jgi:hypothetical protein
MNDLRARLENLAAHNQTITYGTLAGDLGLTAPGSIAVLTVMLETLMEQDASLGRAFAQASRTTISPHWGFL